MQPTHSKTLLLIFSFVSALLFCPTDILSQTKATLASRDTLSTLTGSVYDLFTKEPVPDARIQIRGFSYLAASDSTGSFAIYDLPGGWYTVSIRCLGYFPISVDSVKNPQAKPLHVGLKVRLIQQDTEGVAEVAQKDIAQGHIWIRIAGLIAIRDTLEELAIRHLEAKYGFQSIYSGCTDAGADLYNRAVYQYLDSLNGKGWRYRLEEEIKALRTRKQ